MIELYNQLCSTKSDIYEHLPTLKRYGEKVNHITELGIRSGRSTCALLMAKPKVLRCYDLKIHKNLPLSLYQNFANQNNIDFKLVLKNVLKTEIDPTDLLLIDTYHSYTQLTKELKKHVKRVKRFLVFHDTEMFGLKGEDKKSPGLLRAINEFVEKSGNWKILEKFNNNNGLMILEKVK